MKARIILIVLALAALLAIAVGLSAAQGPSPTLPTGQAGGEPQALVGSAFTYQGQLLKNGSPVNANCLMAFRLYDAATGGNLVGTPFTTTVNIAGGLFTVALNFPGAFTGDARFLQAAVACPGDPGFVTLSPRQNLTATPYALSLKPGAVISGTLSDSGGINAINWAINGSGVYGWARASDGSSYGVYGRSDSSYGFGLYGWAPYAGAYGGTETPGGYGVLGVNSSTEGSGGIGVFGWNLNPNGYGVRGYSSATSGSTRGVHGEVASPNGWAGFFSTAVGNGVYITAPAGKAGLNVAGGTKNAVVRTSSGSRLLYTEESAEVWFTDYGFGQLKNGVAVITIDPLYAQTVNLKEPYLVFLTPQGDCGLYVAEKTPTAFTVRALGGRACNIAFDYRIVAKRLGYEDARLAPAPWAEDDPNLYPDRAPAAP